MATYSFQTVSGSESGALGYTGVEFVGINDTGQVIGDGIIPDAFEGNFVYANGVFTPINLPQTAADGYVSIVYMTGINNEDQIVGALSLFKPNEGNPQVYGYVYTKGSLELLGGTSNTFGIVPGNYINTIVRSINNAGQIVANFGPQADFSTQREFRI